MVDDDSVVAALRSAAEGLFFISESDAPLEPFLWPAAGNAGKGESAAEGPMTPDVLRTHAKAAADAPMTGSEDVDAFFRSMTTEQDWFGPEEKATAERFRALVQTLKDNLTDLRVFRVGEIDIDVYVVGRTKGGSDFAGVKTHLVET